VAQALEEFEDNISCTIGLLHTLLVSNETLDMLSDVLVVYEVKQAMANQNAP
jgi:hypothetical protein